MNTLKTILYFSIFRHPLKIEEIHSFSKTKSISETRTELNLLEEKKIIENSNGFYVYNKDTSSIEKRVKGNIAAAAVMQKAFKRALFIYQFPFIEGVAISGSLSKGYFDSNSDVDFFIITKPKRLWIARSLLIIYKKIFLFNSRKFFCLNYFISSNNLEISEKNIFTATEVKTLIPVYGTATMHQFYQKNQWVSSYFPNFICNFSELKDAKKSLVSKWIELLFESKTGEFLDSFFKKITLMEWKRKFATMSQSDFEIAFKNSKETSKHHPNNFQKKVIVSLNEKIEEVKTNFAIEIPKEHV